MGVKEILSKAKKDKIRIVELHFTDIHGMIKSVTIPVEKLKTALERGVWFDGSSIEGFTRIAESDMYLKPDMDTYAVVPWKTETKTCRFICDIYTPDDKPFKGDPRHILKLAIEKAKKMGYGYFVGPELEFFLFQSNGDKTKPALHDSGAYFDYSPRDLATEIRNQIVFALKEFGLDVEMLHHEVAPGQHEIDFRYGDALKTADNAITLKYVVKSIAHANGLHATFMAKPVFGENGSGMHVHQSLFDLKKKKNAFYDPKDSYFLSKIAKSFIAGQLKHIKAMTAVIAPTVNSYKRLVPGYEAPVYICWATKNRSALIRVPRFFKGQGASARCELRCGDPSSNPYLAFAVMLESGLDGMKNKMVPPKPTEEDVYEFSEKELTHKKIDTLPKSLGGAIHELKRDKVVLDALGEHAGPLYVRAKKKEFLDYSMQVTEWEKEKYFESV